MRRFGIRLFMLTAYAAVLAAAMASPLKAAGNDTEAAKARKKVQQSTTINDRKDSTWPPPMYDDFDRKNTSSGGM